MPCMAIRLKYYLLIVIIDKVTILLLTNKGDNRIYSTLLLSLRFNRCLVGGAIWIGFRVNRSAAICIASFIFF